MSQGELLRGRSYYLGCDHCFLPEKRAVFPGDEGGQRVPESLLQKRLCALGALQRDQRGRGEACCRKLGVSCSLSDEGRVAGGSPFLVLLPWSHHQRGLSAVDLHLWRIPSHCAGLQGRASA